MEHNDLTGRVIGCAMEVHSTLGPGLLESAYKQCLAHELSAADIAFKLEEPIPVDYKSHHLDCGYRADLLVEDTLMVELKSVEALLGVHEAQLLTHMKLAEMPVGLLINFNVKLLKEGIRRFVL